MSAKMTTVLKAPLQTFCQSALSYLLTSIFMLA